MTREEMISKLNKFCDGQQNYDGCILDKFVVDVCGSDCVFDDWTDDKLVVACDIVYKNSEARLDGSHLKESNETPDMVNHPKHYTQGGIECIDAIKAATVGKRGIEAVCVANVIKYCWRYEEKNGVEDVRKAKFYLERLIKEMKESQQG